MPLSPIRRPPKLPPSAPRKPLPVVADSSRPKSGQPSEARRELNRNMQTLQAEINDLEKQRTDLRAGNLYGDPTVRRKNEEIRQLGTQIDAKRAELSSIRAELQEMNERAAHTSVLQ